MAAATSTANPPLDYAVAVWLGMAEEDVLRGLHEGWVRRPPGTPPNWLPAEAALATGEGGVGETPEAAGSLRRWLGRLDPSLGEAGVDAVWQEAGADDAARARTVARFLAGALGLGDELPAGSVVEAALARVGGDARVIRLADKPAAELEMMARADGAVRRALATHTPWALAGERAGDPDGHWDRFDPNTGERLISDAWISDRAAHLAWRRDGEGGSVDGDGWRFIDRGAGPSADVEVTGSTGVVQQVIFAHDDGDSVRGGNTTDRIYGGPGDDALRGRGGDDRLEGGGGHDELLGGAGRDELFGGRGDDTLDGGAGNDSLDGGSGGDELAGGRGDDLLAGGDGEDRYAFEAGDGVDVIVDDDGSILVDDATVAGTYARGPGGWRSEDGRHAFAVVDGNDGPVLRIASVDGGNRIEVRGWRQGGFGITLLGLDDEDAPHEGTSPVEDWATGPRLGDGIDEVIDPSSWVDLSSLDALVAEFPTSLHYDAAAPAPDTAVLTPADLAQGQADAAGEAEALDAAPEMQSWLADTSLPWTRDPSVLPTPPDPLVRRHR